MDAAGLTLLSFFAGLGVAVLTTPVGVSGAVFLLPIQVSILQVPNPAVTPTNLLFNIVAIPGALARYRTKAPLSNPLTSTILLGTLPGVVIGAVVRVFLIPGPHVFRLLVAAFLMPLGVWLCWTTIKGSAPARLKMPPRPFTIAIALAVGVLGGIYGVGGGSLLSPILVGRGLPIAVVAPAALITTFVTSIVGATTYAILAATTASQHIAPDWVVGLVAGVGGLIGGYAGAWLQPRLPERGLRIGLGVLAVATALAYGVQAVL